MDAPMYDFCQLNKYYHSNPRFYNPSHETFHNWSSSSYSSDYYKSDWQPAIFL